MASTPQAGTLPRVQPDELEAYRRELTGYCYRMLGSGFEAEDAVQDTMLRAWRSADRFEGRASVRSWLYRIATNVCVDMLRGRKRRARPMELGPPSPPDEGHLGGMLPEHLWVSPIPDTRVLPEDGDPAEIAVARDTVRLAFVTALQHLPARQRAVLILCEVLRWPAAETAELLDTSVAAVNSALQRARAHLAEVAPSDDDVVEPEDRELMALVERYCAAFENGDMAALTALLQADVKLEMPPFAVWFTGRDAVTRFLAMRAFAEPGAVLMIATSANGQPAVADYRRDADGAMRAHAIHVLTPGEDGIAAITVFLDPDLFPVFGMPLRR
jgi:RNA polymerase sigma-70 factor, ECF subfamily